MFLRPLERYAGQELPFAAEALAAPQQTTYGQSCEVRLKLGGQSCTAVLYFDEADADIRPGDTLSGLARITTCLLYTSCDNLSVCFADCSPGRGALYFTFSKEAAYGDP